MDIDKESIVQYIPKKSSNKCGYCKSKNGSKQIGLWAFQLKTQDYQNLIDRGWRRSGNYCYKPILSESCCALYTIRCDATKFQLKRSQKKVLKNVNLFLKSGGMRRKSYTDLSVGGDEDLNTFMKANHSLIPELAVNIRRCEQSYDVTGMNSTKMSEAPIHSSPPTSKAMAEERGVKNLKKAKEIRICRKRAKLIAKGYSHDEIREKMVEKKKFPVVKNVEDFINEGSTVGTENKLEVRLVRSSPACEGFKLSLAESYALYCKYQIRVHHDKPSSLSQDSYERFLVNSPLIAEGNQGSFHQQYWLNGKLIAVGVVDVLPLCVSSVYLYYDPDYSFLSLGTYSSLREVFLVRSISNDDPKIKFYYMGFYIRTCPKMRYKGSMSPSFLLCPEVYSWHPIGDCLSKIDMHAYSRLNENEEASDTNEGEVTDQIRVIYNGVLQRLQDLPKLAQLRNGVSAYLKTVGAECSNSILLQLQ